MTEKSKSFLYGFLTMSGMAIGAGLFGVPYVLSRAGAVTGVFYFIILGAVVVCSHLIYGETLLRTKGEHRLPGLTGIYLGKKWKYAAVAASVAGFYAVIIAYIILGGSFLHTLFSPFFGGAVIYYQIIFFAVMALIILAGLKMMAASEAALTIFLLAAIVFLSVWISGAAHIKNFTHFDLKEIFLPYGVILFSITGAAAVPEVLEIMKKNKKNVKTAIVWGSIIPIILIAVFSFAVLGATGAGTAEEAISGLGQVFGSWILYAGAAFGLLAVATSFLPLALYAKEQFVFDFKINGALSWVLACVIPFLIFLFGTKDFIKIIGFSGAVFSGFEAFLIIGIYIRAKRAGERKPEYEIRPPIAFLYIMGVIFLLGMVYEIGTFFR